MFYHAVAFHDGVFCHLRAVTKGWNGILFCTRDKLRVAIDFGAITNPHIIKIVAFDQRVIEHLSAMFNKGKIHHRIAVNLRLVHHPRLADGGVIEDL
ncbi:hypothetical protein D3C80_1559730 [compost metagenome]